MWSRYTVHLRVSDRIEEKRPKIIKKGEGGREEGELTHTELLEPVFHFDLSQTTLCE